MRLVGVIGLVAVLACISIAVAVFHLRWRARVLLEDVKRLDTSADPSLSFKAFTEKHRNQLAHEECRNDLCESDFLVNNRVLSSLHLAPRAELRARITLFHQKPNTLGLDYTSAIFEQNSPIVHVQEDFCAYRRDIRCDHFALNPHGRNVTPAWNGIVEFGQSATNEQKEVAWGLNLDCLLALRGCKDISQLSPRIWKTTRVGLVSSCIRSSADSAAESSQPLSDACSVR